MTKVIIIILILFFYFVLKKNKIKNPYKQNIDDEYISLKKLIEFQGTSNYKKIESIVRKAEKFYPNIDPRKALELFKKVLEIAPDASSLEISPENIDTTSIGFACWAALVCNDIVNEEDDSKFEELIEIIKIKSPLTAQRYLEQTTVSKEKLEKHEKINEINNEISNLINQNNKEILISKINELKQINKDWWQLRDLADSLVKSEDKKIKDIAWGLYNESLLIRAKNGGDCSTIYDRMGYLRKSENAFFDALKFFLFAFSETQKKTLDRQVSICLNKLIPKTDIESIKQRLIEAPLNGKKYLSEELNLLKQNLNNK